MPFVIRPPTVALRMNFIRTLFTGMSAAETTSTLLPPAATTPGHQLATFAGGCFWGIEKFFKQQFQASITNVSVGYTGGNQPLPTYKQVCTGSTGHAEAFRMEFDPQRVQYGDLVEYLFRIHDPTTPNRQGNDVGTQYRSAVFYHSEEQRAIAEQIKAKVQAERYSGQPISTEIVPAKEFYRAEEYHQRYLELHPAGYCNHRPRCGCISTDTWKMVDQLLPFGSCDIADALQRLGHRPNYLPGLEMRINTTPDCEGYRTTKIIGPAFTVQMVEFNDTISPRLTTPFIDQATSGCVIVISTPANSINAVWGGLMAQRAKMLGVKGTIIDGNCRDLVELQDMQFPVFSRGHSALSANQYTRASTINQPVVIAGCQINPGDIVVADVDGVVVFPADVIDRVVEEAKKLTEIDGKCMNDIGRGISVQQAFATHRGK